MAADRLPVASGKAVLRALQKVGFTLRRVRGSHHVLTHPGPPLRMVSVPVHGNRPLPPGTLSAILEQADLSVEELVSLL